MLLMWWVMMIAMMTPSATPTILLYARVYRHAIAQGHVQDKLAPSGVFAAGYLVSRSEGLAPAAAARRATALVASLLSGRAR